MTAFVQKCVSNRNGTVITSDPEVSPKDLLVDALETPRMY
jgi:hypothetical protein